MPWRRCLDAVFCCFAERTSIEIGVKFRPDFAGLIIVWSPQPGEHGCAWQLPADASDGGADARRRITDVKVGNADEGHSLTAELKLVT